VSLERPNIGFIGLGTMGRPMALNLLGAGYPVTVHSRSEALVAAFAQAGGSRADSPAQLGSVVDVAITMLPDTPDVESVVLGSEGLLSGMKPNSLLIDMSTISPSATREIGEQCLSRSVGFVDAPVSGGQQGAIDAALTIMVGGSDRDFAGAREILEHLGSNITHVGAVGAGQVTKAANQLIVGSNIVAVAEALRLASDAGVDAEKVRSALIGGFATSRVLEVHGQRMINRQFDPGFRSELHLKDARIVLDTAEAYGTGLTQFPAVVELQEEMTESQMGALDHSALYLAVEAHKSTQS
jgi:2-hydroxy-3-oxopropionate reductase